MFVCGCSYDDYDYGEVNQLLERDLKLYIKAVACFPDATKTPVCPLSWALLKTSERVRRFFILLTLLYWRRDVNKIKHVKPGRPSSSSFLFFLDTCEFTNHGGPTAGGAALRSESHHSVHDCLSAWRGTKSKLFAGTETQRDTRIKMQWSGMRVALLRTQSSIVS